MTDTNGDELRCGVCDELGCYFSDEDGHFYCNNCNARVDDVVATGVADEDFVDTGGGGATYNPHYTRYTPSVKPELFDPAHLGPKEPADFGDVLKGVIFRMEDYYKSVRVRYVLGVQLLVEYQCEKLVEVFRVSPIICGIAGEVWLRFVASKRVFSDTWADVVIEESEIQGEKKCKVGNSAKNTNEPRNMYRKRMANIWCKSLKKTIPLSSSLAVSYLACHIAREAVLPSDIVKWAIEGKLPYFGAFPKIKESIKQIERSYNCPSVVCPLEANNMFRPSQSVSLQKLESMAASIAHSIGLNLPPVNFYAIAFGYLKQLCLPVNKILPYACRIEEWAMPPELWLSVNERRIPTRVCVMSILIVAIRILYNINDFGKWEMTLSNPNDNPSMDNTLGSDDDAEAMPTSQTMDVDQEGTSSSVHKFESDCAELLQNLQKKYDDLNNRHEYSDLPTYLQYCKDVVFAGLEPLYKDPVLIDELWDFYQKNREGMEASGEVEPGLPGKRSRDGDKQFGTTKEYPNNQANEPTISLSANSGQSSYSTFQDSQPHQTSFSTDKVELSRISRDIAIRHMKIDMEEQIFCYIPPRVKVKRHGYLHYSRKAAGDGAYTCSKVAQVDPRVMHESVLSLERRLGWIEKRIDECVHSHKKHSKPFTSDKISSSSFPVH